jgi:hypothetical protein
MKGAEIFDFTLRKPGYIAQQLILIDAGQKKLGLAYCIKDRYYQIVPKEDITEFEGTIRESNTKPYVVDAQSVEPILKLGEKADTPETLEELSDSVSKLLLTLSSKKQED